MAFKEKRRYFLKRSAYNKIICLSKGAKHPKQLFFTKFYFLFGSFKKTSYLCTVNKKRVSFRFCSLQENVGKPILFSVFL
ncbi:MAG: hypothetical protein EAZ95_17360 [Bacteroidetes bacterium]|nr:MAG: hypothetical protein EAZ95_17360 [Bacteroidota bacterium]